MGRVRSWPVRRDRGGPRNLELSVTSKDMLKWIRGNDQNNICHVSKNSKTFFKKELSEDVLGQTLYRCPAPDHPEDSDPFMEVKVTMSGKNKTNRIEEETNARGEGEGCPVRPWQRGDALVNGDTDHQHWRSMVRFKEAERPSSARFAGQAGREKAQGDFVGNHRRVGVKQTGLGIRQVLSRMPMTILDFVFQGFGVTFVTDLLVKP